MKQCPGQISLFSAEASLDDPANLSVWPESKKAKRTNGSFGPKCSELSESLRRVGFSVRTYLESSTSRQTRFVPIWSVRVTKSGYSIMKLRLSERRIGESESRLLPTPCATLGTNGGPNQRDSSGRPGLQMAAMMWPTPRAGGSKGSSPAGAEHGDLAAIAGGQLNPDWVEWLMGFPIGHTSLTSQE